MGARRPFKGQLHLAPPLARAQPPSRMSGLGDLWRQAHAELAPGERLSIDELADDQVRVVGWEADGQEFISPSFGPDLPFALRAFIRAIHANPRRLDSPV